MHIHSIAVVYLDNTNNKRALPILLIIAQNSDDIIIQTRKPYHAKGNNFIYILRNATGYKTVKMKLAYKIMHLNTDLLTSIVMR